MDESTDLNSPLYEFNFANTSGLTIEYNAGYWSGANFDFVHEMWVYHNPADPENRALLYYSDDMMVELYKDTIQLATIDVCAYMNFNNYRDSSGMSNVCDSVDPRWSDDCMNLCERSTNCANTCTEIDGCITNCHESVGCSATFTYSPNS